MAATEYDFATTQSQIIEAALREVGGIYEGQPMSAYQEENGLQKLNQLVKSWQNRQVFIWTERTFTVPLVIGTHRYALEDDPTFISINKAYLRKATTNEDIRLERMSWADYQDIENKTESGEPLIITIDPDVSDNEIVLWPVPLAADSLYILGTIKLKDFADADGTGNIAPNWELALIWALALELSSSYGVPLQERQWIEKRANVLFAEAKLGERKQITNDEDFVKPAFRRRRR